MNRDNMYATNFNHATNSLRDFALMATQFIDEMGDIVANSELNMELSNNPDHGFASTHVKLVIRSKVFGNQPQLVVTVGGYCSNDEQSFFDIYPALLTPQYGDCATEEEFAFLTDANKHLGGIGDLLTIDTGASRIFAHDGFGGIWRDCVNGSTIGEPNFGLVKEMLDRYNGLYGNAMAFFREHLKWGPENQDYYLSAKPEIELMRIICERELKVHREYAKSCREQDEAGK